MYKTRYKVPFKNIDNDDLCVQILEKDGTSSTITELRGGHNPFVVEVNTDEFLYTPTRFSGATLRVYGNDMLSDLFTTDYHKWRVVLTWNQKVVWIGFITPDLYSQDWSNAEFELEIECISAMSTLKYVNFEHNEPKISFKDLILKCVDASNGELGVYVSDGLDKRVFDETYISRGNFFDEDGKPMTLEECLIEVCKFINMTAVEYGPILYFVDIDDLNHGNSQYRHLSSGVIWNGFKTKEISVVKHKGNEDTFSILGGYNKVTVIDSDYELDSEDLYPEITLDQQIHKSEIQMGADGKSPNDEKDVEKQNVSTYKLIHYLSDKFKTYNYDYAGNNNWITPPVYDISFAGCHILNQASFKNNDKPIRLDWTKMFEIKMKCRDGVLDGTSDYDPDKYRLHPDVEKLLNNELTNWLKPQFVNYFKNNNDVSYPNDAYLGLNLSVCLVPSLGSGFRGVPIELQHKKDKVGDVLGANFAWDDIKVKLEDIYFVPATIKIGDKYWDGTEWTTSKRICKLPLDVNKETHIEGQWISLKNNNSYEKGVEDLGECILIPINEGLYGNLEIEFYIPVMPARTKEYIYIKDVTVDSARIHISGDTKKEKQDTKYTSDVNPDYVNELDDIEFKITSSNNSNICYSKAVDSWGRWLDKYKERFYPEQFKPEELLITRIINQYHTPKKKWVIKGNYCCNDSDPYIHSFLYPMALVYMNDDWSQKAVLTGGTIDFENNSMEYNLISYNTMHEY